MRGVNLAHRSSLGSLVASVVLILAGLLTQGSTYSKAPYHSALPLRSDRTNHALFRTLLQRRGRSGFSPVFPFNFWATLAPKAPKKLHLVNDA